MDADQEKCLLKWVNSFETLSTPASSVEELANALALGRICSQIFSDFSHRGGQTPTEIFQGIIKVCETEFDQTYSNIVSPAFAATGHPAELLKMTTLVLVASVQCDNKAKFIRQITNLDNESQFQLKAVIEDMITRCSSAGVSFNSPRKRESLSGPRTSSPAFRRQSLVEQKNTPISQYRRESTTSTAPIVKDLRDRLEKANDELHDALVMHDEVLTEVSEKNKTIDALNFRIRDMEGKVERFRSIQDEFDELRGIEALYNKLEPQFQACKEELAAAKARLVDLESLQKDFMSLSSKSKEDCARLTQLEARVRDYRVNIKSTELKLTEERSSNTRKDVEINRLVQARDDANDEIARLKSELGSVKMQAIREHTEMEHESASTDFMNDRNELMREISELRDENMKLAYSDDKLKLKAAQEDLDDAIALQAATEKRLNEEIIQRDNQVSDLQEQLTAVEIDLSSAQAQISVFMEKSKTGNDAHRELRLAHSRIMQLEGELHTAKRAVKDATLSSKSATVKKQQTFGVAPPWATNSPLIQPDYFHGTDADRMAELERRNEKRMPHLRSQYALELQEINSNEKTTTTNALQSAKSATSINNDKITQNSFEANKSRRDQQFSLEISTKIQPQAQTEMAFTEPLQQIEAYVAEISPPKKSQKKSMPEKLRKRMEERAAQTTKKQKERAAQKKKEEAEAKAAAAAQRAKAKAQAKKPLVKRGTFMKPTKKSTSLAAKPAPKTAIPTSIAPSKPNIKRSTTRTVLKQQDPNKTTTVSSFKLKTGTKSESSPPREWRELPSTPSVSRLSNMPCISVDMFETHVVNKHGPKNSPARPFTPEMNKTTKSPFVGSTGRSKSFTTPSGGISSRSPLTLGLVDYLSDRDSPAV